MSSQRHEQLAKKVMPMTISALGFLGMHMAQKNRRLRHEATHDALTGLLNTRGLEALLVRNKPPIALLYIDGTNQKAVNDKLGHARGDEGIVGTAQIAVNSLRSNDIAARIGGDEFLIALNRQPRDRHRGDELQSPEKVLAAVQSRIYDSTQAYLDENPDLREAGFDIAVGGAVWQAGMSVDDVRSAAEKAMYHAKDQQHGENGSYR